MPTGTGIMWNLLNGFLYQNHYYKFTMFSNVVLIYANKIKCIITSVEVVKLYSPNDWDFIALLSRQPEWGLVYRSRPLTWVPSSSRRHLQRSGVSGHEVSEVIMGQVYTAGQGQNPARQSSVNAGIPVEARPHSFPSMPYHFLLKIIQFLQTNEFCACLQNYRSILLSWKLKCVVTSIHHFEDLLIKLCTVLRLINMILYILWESSCRHNNRKIP